MSNLRTLLTPIICAIAVAGATPTALAQSQPQLPSPQQTAVAVQRLIDENAVRNLMYHYARGNDNIAILYSNRALGRQRGTAEYSKAFTPDVRIEVRAIGGDKPIGQFTGIPPWTEFVDNYYAGNAYSSTLHLMSNFEIEFDGVDRANVSAYALAPHFFVRAAAKDAASADTAVEWMIARYAYRAERQRDGGWKIARLQIYLEEISRAAGFFPGGQRNGR